MKMGNTLRRKIHYNASGSAYFYVYGRKWFLYLIDRNTGMNTTLFTNCGYYGGYVFDSIENGIDDFAILKKYAIE